MPAHRHGRTYRHRACRFCEYAGQGVSFDAVVSNPPFSRRKSRLRTEDGMLARHGADLDYGIIMRACACGLLSADGILSMVSPAERQNDIMFDMELCGLRLSRMTRVFTKPGAQEPSRLLWEMRRDKGVTAYSRRPTDRQ